MEWEIVLSRQAEKFLSKNRLPDQFIVALIVKSIRKLSGESVAADVKRFSGNWAGYYRVRHGKIRTIFSFRAEERRVFVESIDYRGNVYR